MSDPTATYAKDAGARPGDRRKACRSLSLVVAILIAAVLQFAAAAKVSHGADVLRRMKDAQFDVQHGLPVRNAFNPADYGWFIQPDEAFKGGVPIEFPISAGEFLLVVLVLAGHRSRWVWLIVPIVFATFFGYALQRLIAGLPCGCFGDLWRPPDGASMTLDALFVLAGLLIAWRRRAHPSALIGALVLCIAGLAGGYAYAANNKAPGVASNPPRVEAPPSKGNPAPTATTPSTPKGNQQATAPAPTPTFDPGTPASKKLAASALMADDLEAQKENGEPEAYYVFIWDPTCSTCERLKPVIEDYQRQYQEEANPFLQVLLFMKQDLRDSLGIQTYEWDSSPSVFVVRGGEVTDLPGGEEAVLPDEVLEKLTHDEPLTGEH